MSLVKLSPVHMIKNPVMFMVWVGSVLLTFKIIMALIGLSAPSGNPLWFDVIITLTLWLTVLFANLSESIAEGRGKAQASSLLSLRQELSARVICANDREEFRPASALRKGDVVLVKAGELIPTDGEVIKGIASVDESAITGESAPVIRESGGDRSSVTGGTKILSDELLIRVTTNPGQSFIDQMIALVQGAKRQKTPNEIALHILLVGMSIIFLLVVMTLVPVARLGGLNLTPITMIALLVCLIPTTIGGLVSAIGISGMERLLRKNVLAMSGRAVEAAGDIDVLLMDKTGTITFGNRMAHEIIPMAGIEIKELARVAELSSLADETPEGKSIVKWVEDKFGRFYPDASAVKAEFVPFRAETRMSGCDAEGHIYRKGAMDAVRETVMRMGGQVPVAFMKLAQEIGQKGGTPLGVMMDNKILGVIYLKDIVKPGMKQRFQRLRAMGIKTIMITGDNPFTASAIAKEAGVDDFLAEATPEKKMELIRLEQQKGHQVAMTGDGTNDAPALAQADVALAMNTGTQAAKEAANMIDLDSDPTKLIEIVEVGKQLLMTRGCLTTFSISNDVAKYFAVLPALFLTQFPVMQHLNFMHLKSPYSAILAAVIFNALIIIALVPLALKGVNYRPMPVKDLLRRSIFVFGLGGVVTPFIGIKLIDMLLSLIGLS